MLSIEGRGMLLNAVHPCWIVQVPSRSSSSCYREGVPSVVVFKISLSYVKTFHYRPQHLQPLPGLLVRCATSLRWLCYRQVRRPSHQVQVQSPISTAHFYIIVVNTIY